jgi:hypothetical protein
MMGRLVMVDSTYAEWVRAWGKTRDGLLPIELDKPVEAVHVNSPDPAYIDEWNAFVWQGNRGASIPLRFLIPIDGEKRIRFEICRESEAAKTPEIKVLTREIGKWQRTPHPTAETAFGEPAWARTVTTVEGYLGEQPPNA